MTAGAFQVPAVAVAALLMIVAGTEKRTLEWKARRRRCPSCGRDACQCRFRA